MNADELQIIDEEQALLDRVLSTLSQARQKGRQVEGANALLTQLEDLREEAASAHVADLPHLLHQMEQTRFILDREKIPVLPDPKAPYFAHMKLRSPDGEVRDYLLGRNSFADVGAGVRIVDWRFAPIARVFYCYDEGEGYEESFGDRVSEGTVETRRLVVIERGVLTRVTVGQRVYERDDDGSWHRVRGGPGDVLSGGTGTATRPLSIKPGKVAPRREDAFGVTALLDAEQYDAVATGPERPLLVLGSAGSGKTTVALHRLSKIAFDKPHRYPQKRLKVIVPEEGLARLTRRLLSPLGLDRVPVETLWNWSYASACEAFGVRSIKVWADSPPLVARLKRHPVLRRALAARLGAGSSVPPTLPKLRIWLGDAFADKEFLQAVVKGSNGELPLPAIDDCVRHTKLQLAAPLSEELEGIDPDKLITVDGMSIEQGTPDELAETVDLEDLPILLFLKAQQGDSGLEPLAHVVLDEAEDFSLFELSVVKSLLGDARSCTLAGDEVQQTSSGFAGWSSALNELGIRDAATCRLQVSYRCPRPVVAFARSVLGDQARPASEATGREGPPVGHHHFPDEAQASLFVGEALRDLMAREPNASVAVIAHSPDSARKIFRVIQDMPWARLVQEGAFSFEAGVDVTDVENVKGLEFDYVIIPDATAVAYPVDPEARRRLHVAATRASHQLWVVSSGVRSKIAKES